MLVYSVERKGVREKHDLWETHRQKETWFMRNSSSERNFIYEKLIVREKLDLWETRRQRETWFMRNSSSERNMIYEKLVVTDDDIQFSHCRWYWIPTSANMFLSTPRVPPSLVLYGNALPFTTNSTFLTIITKNIYNQKRTRYKREPDSHSSLDPEDDRRWGRRNVGHYHQQSFSRLN